MGSLACAASVSRRDPSAREDGAGWTGGDTVRPVRTSEPPLLGASAGSSGTRGGVSVRLTTRPDAGSAGAPAQRRRVGDAGATGRDRKGARRGRRVDPG